MPTVKTQTRARRDWTAGCLSQLEFGFAFFSHDGGWGNFGKLDQLPDAERAEILDDMRACWAVHGDTITAECRKTFPLEMPWGWWTLSSPEPRDRTQPSWFHNRNRKRRCEDFSPEWYQLIQLGVLDEATVRGATAEAVGRYIKSAMESQGYLCFRRPLAWWLWHAPRSRDPAMLELSQLTKMNCLLDCEHKIMAGDAWHLKHSTFFHLFDGERELLGLPPFTGTKPLPIGDR